MLFLPLFLILVSRHTTRGGKLLRPSNSIQCSVVLPGQLVLSLPPFPLCTSELEETVDCVHYNKFRALLIASQFPLIVSMLPEERETQNQNLSTFHFTSKLQIAKTKPTITRTLNFNSPSTTTTAKEIFLPLHFLLTFSKQCKEDEIQVDYSAPDNWFNFDQE